MHIPLWSLLTLSTELVVTCLVYYIIVSAYRRGTFNTYLAFGVLSYELLFNITYMASRLFSSDATSAQIITPYETVLAVFHGTFSLLMFIALVAFFISAYHGYQKSENFFRSHPAITLVFSCAWLVSILSGILFFFALYVA